MKRLFLAFLALFSATANAYNWPDLWLTPDQQAQKLMEKGQYAQAKDQFQNQEWAGSAAYRAQDYQFAAKSFEEAKSFYNAGNALAHLGKYDQAIKAYDKALALNPNDSDTIFNRKLVEDLMKKNPQDNKDQQQDKDKKDQEQQDQDKQNQDQQNQDKQDQDKKDQDKQDQDKQDQNNQDQNQQDKQDKQDKRDPDQQDPKDQKNKQDEDEEQAKKPQPQAQSDSDKEKQQAKEQWLRLIPDDPGGLLREKFLRDHLRRERG